MRQILSCNHKKGGRTLNWTTEEIRQWMDKLNDNIQTNKQLLTKLDQAIGDGDHGINMARGFQKVVDKLHETTYTSISDILKDIAMSIISNVGGASGPLYGTAFLRLSAAVVNVKTMDQAVLSKGVTSAVAGIKQRGKAAIGEKTAIDVWEPVADYLAGRDDISPHELRKIAEEAMEETKDMQATKGRAAYLKERSIGHVDPGAMSSYFIFKSLAEVLEGGNRR